MSQYDVLAKLIETGVKLFTSPCYCIEYTDNGKCAYCKGEGTVVPPLTPARFVAGAAGVKISENDSEPCTECEGSGTCSACEGAREVVPKPDNSNIVAFVSASTIQGMIQLREAERFDEFHETLDAAGVWLGSIMKNADDPTEDQMRKVLESFGDLPKSDNNSESNNALTPEELRDLGITDAD